MGEAARGPRSQFEGRLHQTLGRFEAAHAPAQLGGLLRVKIHLRAAPEIIRQELAANSTLQASDAKEAALAGTLAELPHLILDHEPIALPAGGATCGAHSMGTYL